MNEAGHVHEWATKTAVFRDFCHYTLVEKSCKWCPVSTQIAVERDFGLNPIQIAFADPDCAQCRRLARGHEPDSWKAEHREGCT